MCPVPVSAKGSFWLGARISLEGIPRVMTEPFPTHCTAGPIKADAEKDKKEDEDDGDETADASLDAAPAMSVPTSKLLFAAELGF